MASLTINSPSLSIGGERVSFVRHPFFPMSLSDALTQRDKSAVLVLFCLLEAPLGDKEEAFLLERLPPASRALISGITNRAHRIDSLLSRALALVIAKTERLEMVENRPYSPRLLKGGVEERILSISHTSKRTPMSAVALSPAQTSGAPMPLAIDCETLIARKNYAALIAHTTPPAVAERVVDAMNGVRARNTGDEALLFYRAWGQYECATKLNFGTRRYQLIPGKETGADVWDSEQNATLTTSSVVVGDAFLITLVTQTPHVPLFCAEVTLNELLSQLG